MTTIAVLGATGQVGGVVSDLLLQRGVKVRAIGRSAERLQPLAARGAEVALAEVDDPKALSRAFRGADAAFVLLPPAYDHPDPASRAQAVGDAIGTGLQVARVQHAVFLSSTGADQSSGNGPIAWLHGIEQRLDLIPNLNLVHLRPGFFVENHLGSIGIIKAMGVNGAAFLPDLPMPMIATRDIAVVAAELLAMPSFSGRQHRELQGARDYTHKEATAILGAAIGRPDLAYVQFSYDDARLGMTGAGLSAAMADAFVEMAHGFNTGHTHMLEARTAANTTPTTLDAWATAVFAPAFRR